MAAREDGSTSSFSFRQDSVCLFAEQAGFVPGQTAIGFSLIRLIFPNFCYKFPCNELAQTCFG